MPINKTVQQILSAATITAGSTTSLGTAQQLVGTVLVAFTVRYTCHASAVNGVELYVFGSDNNSQYDTKPYQTFSIGLTAGGGLAQETKALIPAPAWIKVALKNLDPTQSATDTSVTIQRQEVT